MWKAAGAGAVAILIAGSAFVYAQQRPGPDGMAPDFARYEDGRSGMHRGMHHGMREGREGMRAPMSDDDIGAFTDARIAALKAGLRLTPEQEKNWPAAESAIRDFFKDRRDRMRAVPDGMANRDRDDNRDPIERLRGRAKAMNDRAAALTRLADATEPLYKSLDDAQKRRLEIMTSRMRPRGFQDGPRHHRPGPSGTERL
jgi:hypothetical protein